MPCVGCDSQNIQQAMQAEGVPVRGGRPRQPWGWRGLSAPVETRIAQTLASAVGTPYVDNGRQRGIGLDCRTALVWFTETMERRDTPIDLPYVSPQVGHHSQAQAAAVIRTLIETFGLVEVTGENVIEPGDLIGVRSFESPGVAHGMIAGVVPNTVYHASRGGFAQGSLRIGHQLACVYRPNKEGWA